ncbi:MAG: pyridoxamine 5'-phosphate oxidase family protein [Bacteroidota bacterium]
MGQNFTTYSFTDSVKEAQEKYGSRKMYARMDDSGDQYMLTSRESDFIANMDGFFLSTVGENGWPYVQFRGGPKGFLKVLDRHTLGYADFKGNMQYISTGNMTDNSRVAIIFMDYPRKMRLKVWAESKIVDVADDPELASKLVDKDYRAIPERLVTLDVKAYDWNCPQHIPQRFTLEELKMMVKNDPDIINLLQDE